MARTEDLSTISMLACGDVGVIQGAGATVSAVKRMASMLKSLGTSIVRTLGCEDIYIGRESMTAVWAAK
jgi:hypothetical protein